MDIKFYIVLFFITLLVNTFLEYVKEDTNENKRELQSIVLDKLVSSFIVTLFVYIYQMISQKTKSTTVLHNEPFEVDV